MVFGKVVQALALILFACSCVPMLRFVQMGKEERSWAGPQVRRAGEEEQGREEGSSSVTVC